MGKNQKYKSIDMLGYEIFAANMDECLEVVLSKEKVHIVSGNPEVLYTG